MLQCYHAFFSQQHPHMYVPGLIVSPPAPACMHATVMRAASQHPVLTKFKVSPPA